jgi:hypothetical protein
MADFSENGAIRVNGQWATAIRYEAELNGDGVQEVDLRFMNSRTPVARVTLTRRQALETLGEANLKAIEQGRSPHSSGSAELETIKGDLRGKRLHFRDITVPLGVLATTPNELRGTLPKEPKTPEASPSAQGNTSPTLASKAGALPAHISGRYLIVKNRFHFPDQSVAFVDKGDRLQAKTENTEVIRDLLAIAEHRGWASITVTGSTAFRRSVWREATSLGLTVKGYSPTEVEQLAAERTRPASRTERAAAPNGNATRVQDVPSQANPPGRAQAPTDPRQTVVYGTFLAAGRDRYKSDPKEGMSFYVKVRTADGERTYWGVGLEDALEESRTAARTGDEIGIRQVRSLPVTVPVPQRDAEGRVVGRRQQAAVRNEWAIEKRDYFSDLSRLDPDLDRRLAEREQRKRAGDQSDRELAVPPLVLDPQPGNNSDLAELRARRAQAFRRALRQGQATKDELVRDYPELAPALAWVRVTEIVAERIMTNEQREEFVRLVEEGIASRIERGEKIKTLEVRDVVRHATQTLGGEGSTPSARIDAQAMELSGPGRH